MDDLREYINKLRHEFGKQSLDEKYISSNPYEQFQKWFKEAVDCHVPDCNAFVLSTVSVSGQPSGRILLLRNFSENGFVFYTNYHSKKANDIEKNPLASMTFFWPQLERQIRIEGRLQKQTTEESDNYFNSRPRTSQIGAWASPQSQVIEDRKNLDNRYNHFDTQFKENVPRPAHWGGYLLTPFIIEFWQGRPSRMHDRIEYSKKDIAWTIKRLAP